ncbi:MAG: TolB-like protein [Lysobacterales bacterium]|jgi:TolB-like protein
MSFFEELKRRNVIRVGIAYAVGAWLLLQLTDVLIDLLDLPDTAGKYVILLLVIGFPVALFFAWAFEMTPEGIKRESDVDRSQSIVKDTGHKLDRTIIAILVVALGYFMWDKFSTTAPEVTVEVVEEIPLEKSIAVMPFVNMSADAENEYFSDGLSEELLNLLAKVDGLKVAARTSTFKFKGKEVDIAEIGEQLNVATVLEGSVRKSGNTARITAQLIKVDDGFHLWSETYDRDLDNIFQVQDEIARAIVDALKLPLLGQGETTIATSTASSFEAYDLYLLGRHHFRQRNEASFEKAIDYFTQAAAIDPDYAPAWSGLADAYLNLSDFGTMAQDEAISFAEKALARAEALAPDAVETIIARSLLLNYSGLQELAVPLLEETLVSNPNNVRVITLLARFLDDNESKRKLELAQQAYELDPLSEQTRVGLIGRTFGAGNWNEAESLVRNMLLDDPRNPGLYEVWANYLMGRGLHHQAIPKFEMVHELRPGDVFPAWRIAQNYMLIDDNDAAERWYEVAKKRGPASIWTEIIGTSLHYNRGEWETLAEIYSRNVAEGNAPPRTYLFFGGTLLHLGRVKEAEAMFRTGLDTFGAISGSSISEMQADLIAELANTLEPGEERSQLINRYGDYVRARISARPEFMSTHHYSATLASLENDRDGVMAALQRAVDAGAVYSYGLENNSILGHWNNDPMFMEILAQMRQNAERQRELLAESEAAP